MNILIAGASRGIGLGLVNAHLARGDHVLAVARSLDTADALTSLRAPPGRLEIAECDLTELTAGNRLRDVIGDRRFDVLVFNAGVKTPAHQEVTAVTDAETALLFMTNAIAPARLAQQLADKVVDGGVIGFLSSQMGSVELALSASMPLYGASKAALNSLLRSWVAQIATPRFSVLALHPGWVRTDMGGTNAQIGVEESAAGLTHVIQSYQGRNQHTFVDYQGKTLPW